MLHACMQQPGLDPAKAEGSGDSLTHAAQGVRGMTCMTCMCHAPAARSWHSTPHVSPGRGADTSACAARSCRFSHQMNPTMDRMTTKSPPRVSAMINASWPLLMSWLLSGAGAGPGAADCCWRLRRCGAGPACANEHAAEVVCVKERVRQVTCRVQYAWPAGSWLAVLLSARGPCGNNNSIAPSVGVRPRCRGPRSWNPVATKTMRILCLGAWFNCN